MRADCPQNVKSEYSHGGGKFFIITSVKLSRLPSGEAGLLQCRVWMSVCCGCCLDDLPALGNMLVLSSLQVIYNAPHIIGKPGSVQGLSDGFI
ncbi:MAG: hypothetical protein R8K20_09775 [Gallionellaceae bacterium]